MNLEIKENSAMLTMTVADFDKNATNENFMDYFPQEFKDLQSKYKDSKNYKETYINGRSFSKKEIETGTIVSRGFDGFTYFLQW